MKAIIFLALALSFTFSYAQDRRSLMAPGAPGMPGRGNGGMVSGQYIQVINNIVDRVITYSTVSSSDARKQEIAHYRNEMSNCMNYRNELIPGCLEKASEAVINLAFTPEQSTGTGTTCRLKDENTTIWAGDGQGYPVANSGEKCSTPSAYTRIELIDSNKVSYHAYRGSYHEGYRIKVLEGECAGAIGYMLYVYVENAGCVNR